MRADDRRAGAVVVVRDRDPRAVQHPPPRLFGTRAVSYVHASATGALPASDHVVFNVDRIDVSVWSEATAAHERGAAVTMIVRHVDAAMAAALLRSGWNVIPAYGDTDHIGYGTLRRALRLGFDGTRVVAHGFLSNSIPAAFDAARGSTFLHLQHQMSEEARRGARVVAAVLAPQRSGSQWLRDLIGWTAGADVRVFHEHGVPEGTGVQPDWPSLIDALALEPNRPRQIRMRRAALRDVLLSADRRYIFTTVREPVARVMSYFAKRRARWLREQLDDGGDRLRDPREVQRQFESWLAVQVANQARWYRSALAEPFGLDVCRARPAADGLLVTHHGPNTLIVVPTEELDALRDDVEAVYGTGSCAALADNSAAARGDASVVAAFHRDVYVPQPIAEALRAIPEVAQVRSIVAQRSRGGGI